MRHTYCVSLFLLLIATTVFSQTGIVNPTTVNFGEVQVAQTSAAQVVILKNTGLEELTVSTVAISGNFALPTNTCATPVAHGANCKVFVTYTPNAVETDTGTLTFTDNASNSPQTVSLTGTGTNLATVKTTITASTKRILAGTPITFTVKVVPQKGGTIPDGDQVSLLANQGIIGSGTLLRGVASITTSELKDTNPPQKRPGGDIEPVTAMYAGDQNFAPNSSVPVSINVDRWPTTGSVEVSPNPSMFCQPIAFTPYVTSDGPNAPTGVVYLEGASPVIGAVPIGETETFSGCYFSGYVLYEGDAYNDWSDDFINHTVEPSTTTTTITSSKNPSVLGTAATFKVSVVAPWAKNVYGSVTLTLGATILGTMEIASNTVFIHTSSLPLGQNTVTATYTPLFAREFLGGSASMVQTVSSPKATTTTALVSSLNPSTYGQTVSWTATVTSTGANTPTGTVKFAGIGAGTLSGGVATITKTWLNAAAYPITAEYGGDSASTPSSSSVLNQVVNPASTTTAITSSVNPSSLGQTVTFTATVTSSTGAKPVGSVTFTAGAVTLGTIALAGTSASVSTATLPEGSITVTANYNGATDYTGSSASLVQTVQ